MLAGAELAASGTGDRLSENGERGLRMAPAQAERSDIAVGFRAVCALLRPQTDPETPGRARGNDRLSHKERIMSKSHVLALLLAGSAGALHAQTAPAPTAEAHPELWPTVKRAVRQDPAIERRVEALLARMSIEDKVGQLLQVDIASITPKDLETYKLGSILNGGNSAPNNNETAPAPEWLKLADAFYLASLTRSDGRPAIPVIWGTDAVHGNNNIVGATLFPHNIGLGAMRDPALVERIGQVTALETVAAGIDWSFAPTLAVVQDDRWGRTYESYSEDPALVADYAGRMVRGLQGAPGSRDFLGPARVISSTKHFLADGGTNGRDQGDARISEQELIAVHLGGYPAALAAGTQIVMASFSSWNGVKMSANKSLLTGVLKERMGFDGFIVTDWNAQGQVPGCTNESCAAAINAGIDMFMYSGPGWKQLYANTLAQARSGEIPAARLDDAVRRILRVKLRAGTFTAGRPSLRPEAGKFAHIGAPEHRALARQAVAQSLVLLKNEGVLPLKPRANILVAGAAADSIAQQSGGWSITWQGTDVTNQDFPNAQSIWSGIAETVRAAGGTATYAPDGSFTAKPDAAIVVFGETPYAEFKGDVPTLEYSPNDKADLALLRKLKAAGVPVVAIFLSGRPLWVNAEINASDAFVAAFLPGSEGGGVADVLFRKAGGAVAKDFRGTLSFSWPKRPDQFALNRRDSGYDPLFAFGYGLSYAKPGTVPALDEAQPAGLGAANGGPWFGRGRLADGWSVVLTEPGQSPIRTRASAERSTTAALTMAPIDRRAQEDARRFVWSGSGPAVLTLEPAQPVDLSREANGEEALIVELRVDAAASAPVTLRLTGADGRVARIPLSARLAAAPVGSWQTLVVPLRCFTAGTDLARLSSPLGIETAGALTLSVSDIRIGGGPAGTPRCE
jgi:beta-glucosidase